MHGQLDAGYVYYIPQIMNHQPSIGNATTLRSHLKVTSLLIISVTFCPHRKCIGYLYSKNMSICYKFPITKWFRLALNQTCSCDILITLVLHVIDILQIYCMNSSMTQIRITDLDTPREHHITRLFLVLHISWKFSILKKAVKCC